MAPHGVNTPWPGFRFHSYSRNVNSVHEERPLTLGEFIMGVYDACDEQRARAIVWLAINAQLVCCRAAMAAGCDEGPHRRLEMCALLPDELVQHGTDADHRGARWFE